MDKNDSSGYKSAAWTSMREAWKIVADVHRGALHLRKSGQTYLERFPREHPDKYESRKNWRAVFYDHFRRTLKGFTGLVFANDPTPKDAPKPILDLFDDIDLCGNDLDTFLMMAYEQYLRDGNGYFYVDAPPPVVTEDGAKPTVADVGDRRPYVIFYSASQLINHRYAQVANGQEYLEQATIEQKVIEPDGAFGEQEIIKHRILRPGEVEVRTFAKGEDPETSDKFTSEVYKTGLDTIPLVSIADIGTEPPFMGIALLNILHYNKTSDFDDWCHNANVPQRIFHLNSESDKEDFKKLVASASEAILIWGEYADAKFMEVSGAGAEVTVNRIKDIEAQMARLGLEKLAPINANAQKTATEVDSDNIQSQSELAMLTRRFENAVEQVFYFIGEYLNAIGSKNTVSLNDAEKAKLKLNIEYEKLTYSPQQMTFLQGLLDAGNLSRETFFDLLPNVVNMPDDWTAAIEVERLAKEKASEPPPTETGIPANA